MGLDIYAGPLCRYYVRGWKTTTQQWGESQGIPVTVIRPRESEAIWQKIVRSIVGRPAPRDPVASILAWREALRTQGLFPSEIDWNWHEAPDTEYQTDKPDFDGWGAVQLWAAYAERPEVNRPLIFTRDWSDDPTLTLAAGSPGSEFGNIIGPELWLPMSFDEVVETEEPNGNRCKIGSVLSLWEQLRHLNELTWKATDQTIRGWRQEGFEPENLESMARWGFSIWFCLTEYAVGKRVPMRLDY